MAREWTEAELWQLLEARFGPVDDPADMPADRRERLEAAELEARVHDLCHATRMGEERDLEWFFEPGAWAERDAAMDMLCGEFKDDWGEAELFQEEFYTSAVEVMVFRGLGLTPPWSDILFVQSKSTGLPQEEVRRELDRIFDRKCRKEVYEPAQALVERINAWSAPTSIVP